MSASKLDAVYRSILLTKFFTKGWGKPDNLRRLFEFRKVVSNRDECFKLVDRDYPVTITKEQTLADCRLLEGYFISPLERHLPGIVPEVAQKAHFQAMLPINWQEPKCKPVCLHLAGTGDHYFWRRRNLMVKPLLKEAGIGGIILENPFYGLRKPTDQVRSSLHNVSDIFVMGGCLILESLVLFHWCERNGLGPLGVTGLSMGGHMASLAATNWPKPLVLVPCLSWSTASAVFLQGVMAHSINWDLLEDQYLSDGEYSEKLSKMVTIVDEAFLAGKKFAQTYSKKIEKSTVNNAKNPDKNLDITYKESIGAKNEAQEVDLNKTSVKENKEKGKTAKNLAYITQMEQLNDDLRLLLEEDKISKSLYDKLTSNEKFELSSEDIENINNMNQEKIKEVLLRTKIDQFKNIHIEENNLKRNKTLTYDEEQCPLSENVSETAIFKENSNHNRNHYVNDNNDGADLREEPLIKHNFRDLNAKKPHERNNTDMELKHMKSESTVKSKEAKMDDFDETMSTTSKSNEETLATKTDDTKDAKTEKKSWNVSDITHDFWINLPFVKSSGKKIDIGKIHWRDREALQFMRGIMDECTHLSNFSIPFDTSLIIAVCAKHDAYVPREDVGTLEEIWPGAEVRYVDAGHVSAYILHQSLFRSCIIEAFERSKKKWKDGKHIV